MNNIITINSVKNYVGKVFQNEVMYLRINKKLVKFPANYLIKCILKYTLQALDEIYRYSIQSTLKIEKAGQKRR